jgi:hypothetical protein
MKKTLMIALSLSFVLLMGSVGAYAGPPPHWEPHATLLASDLGITLGSTIGPDGALYVPDGLNGKVWRVNPWTGDTTTFASGFPQTIFPIGGPVDVAFMGHTAYVLVSMVGSDIGGDDIVGIYRVDGPNDFTVIADLGQWTLDNPSESDVFIPTGVYYAMEPFVGGFLVTDGHHNRVLWVKLNGEIKELIAFGNIVPTGLETWGTKIYMGEAGPVPHEPEDGKVVQLRLGFKSPTVKEVASGAPLIVDVEFGCGHTLYALSQGEFPEGDPEGSPALPNTGALVEVTKDGTFDVVIDGLNQPTSLEFIWNTAYVVTLSGEIWRIDGISCPYWPGPHHPPCED